MPDSRKEDETAAWVHWTYSREEWKQFTRWMRRKKGFFIYIVHLLSPAARQAVPEVLITSDRIWIGDRPRAFHSGTNQFRKADIRSEGAMNIMEISYASSASQPTTTDEIRILVPKGKLREAIDLVDRLQKKREGA